MNIKPLTYPQIDMDLYTWYKILPHDKANFFVKMIDKANWRAIALLAWQDSRTTACEAIEALNKPTI